MLRLVAFCGVVQAGLACQTFDHPRLLRGGVFSISCCIPLHLLQLEATGRPESLPAAVEIVKERWGSRQNTLRRVRRAFT
jgi:hypothetical protein